MADMSPLASGSAHDRCRRPNAMRQNIGAIIRPCRRVPKRRPGAPQSLASPERASVSSDRRARSSPRVPDCE
jgi:hypothetical protein